MLVVVGLGGVWFSQMGKGSSESVATDIPGASTSVDNLFGQTQNANSLGLANNPSALSLNQASSAPVAGAPTAPIQQGRKKYNSFPGVISPEQLANKIN